MKILSVDKTGKTATVEWRNQVRTVEYQQLKAESISIPIAGTVGYSGTKLWIGHWEFYLVVNAQGEQWIKAGAYGGLNGKVFNPVCFRDEVAEMAKSKR